MQTFYRPEEQMTNQFVGKVIKVGETDSALVRQIQQALSERGYGPFHAGVFDAEMASVVRLFQSQNVDAIDRPLTIDGEVGMYTWGNLFPSMMSQPSSEPSPLMLQALAMAITQGGQLESPLGSNRGPMVDQYLISVGIDPTVGKPESRYWCMAFVFWCFEAAAKSIGTSNPLPRTAGCLHHWNLSKTIPKAVRITNKNAYEHPELIKPGLVFILDLGQGLGHTGIVEKLLPGGILATIEGNTNTAGNRNGIGVFQSIRRKLNDRTLKGFVDYALC